MTIMPGVLVDATRPATIPNPRTLISESLFERLVLRIVTDHGTTTEKADRIMSQALAFLYACAKNPGAGLAPSAAVDIGWHTFILYTRDYAQFCQDVAGRFIHHQPDDDPARTAGGCTVAETVNVMRTLGLAVDDELWHTKAKCDTDNCHQCHQGCVDSN